MSALAILSLFVFGLLLIVIEVLVIPGIGVAGIAGFGLLALAAWRAWVDIGPMWGAGAAASSVVIVAILVLLLPKTRAGRRLVLEDASTGHADRAGDTELVGTEGVTLTVLRPVGVARFGSAEWDVTAAAGHVDRGEPVRVVGVDGTRVLVEPVPTSRDDPGTPTASGERTNPQTDEDGPLGGSAS